MHEKTKTPLDALIRLVEAPLWRTRREESAMPWFLVRLARTVVTAAMNFSSRHGSSHASALTFYTLLSIVPLAAMAFGVAKGFGFEQLLEKELLKHFAAQQEVVLQVIEFARNMLDNTKGGLVAGIGVAVLFWSVIKVLGKIEDNFNQIWSVPSRSLVRKFTDYLSIMIIAPVLLIMSGSVTVFIASQVSAISSQVGLEDVATPAISLGLSLAPYVLLWLLFTVVYMVMPNTRVHFGSAFLAAVLAGSAYQLLQIGYVKFQIYVTSYNAIYGSFAALPLFLVWLQLSWTIVLFGAQVAHAFPQSNVADARGALQARSASQTKLLALGICHAAIGRFYRDEPPLTEEIISQDLNLATHETREIVDMLIQAGLICRARHTDEDAEHLQPAHDSSKITVQDVMTAMDTLNDDPHFFEQHPKLAMLSACLDESRAQATFAHGHQLLRDLDPADCKTLPFSKK